MNKIFIFLLCIGLSTSLTSQTTLGLGDILFTGYQSDNPDRFSFVLVKPIQAGTKIMFTDKGWLAAGGFRDVGEGILTWTAARSYPSGCEILIYAKDMSGEFLMFSIDALDQDAGTVMNPGGNNGVAFNISGDQLFAYQGDLPTAADMSGFITGMMMNTNNGNPPNATSSTTSSMPSVFTKHVDFFALADNFERDNAVYIGPTTGIEPEELPNFYDHSNWTITSSESAVTDLLPMLNKFQILIPSMSQWALFIMGMLVAGLGLVYMKKVRSVRI